MPVLSQRAINITGDGDDGWSVFYKARKMLRDGHKITELTIGEHDIKTDKTILNALNSSATGGHTGYAIVPGIPELRAKVAKRIQDRTGVKTTIDNVIITPGGQAGLFASHLALGNPGDIGVFIDPYYATYPTTVRSCGLTPAVVQTFSENGFAPSYDDLTVAAKGAKTLLINSPNNPTGTVYDHNTMDTISKVAIENDLWVISDEVYDTQVWQGDHISPRTLPNMLERTVVIGSMSKSHAMTGSRLGWIVAPEHVIEKMIDLATNTTYGVPGYIQDAGLFALNQGHDLEHKVSEPFERRRNLALDVLQKFPRIGHIPPLGAMYLMLDLRKTGLSGLEFANKLLDEKHIAVMPGESFGTSAAGHIRVAMTIPDDEFCAALETVCEFADNLINE